MHKKKKKSEGRKAVSNTKIPCIISIFDRLTYWEFTPILMANKLPELYKALKVLIANFVDFLLKSLHYYFKTP